MKMKVYTHVYLHTKIHVVKEKKDGRIVLMSKLSNVVMFPISHMIQARSQSNQRSLLILDDEKQNFKGMKPKSG